MNLEIETLEEKQKALIVSKKKYSFIQLLRQELERYGTDIFISPHLPKNFSSFDYLFCINEERFSFFANNSGKKLILLFINKHAQAKKAEALRLKNAKVVDISGEDLRKDHIDTILWFSFSEAKETILRLVIPHLVKSNKIFIFPRKLNIASFFSKKNIFLVVIGLFIFIHVSFFIPLSISLFSSYRAFTFLKNDRKERAEDTLRIGSSSLSAAKSLYSIARPTLLFFSLALLPDTLIDSAERGTIVLEQSMLLTENAKEIQRLLFKKNKSKEEKAYLILRIEKLKKEIETIEEHIGVLTQKLPLQFTIVKRIQPQLTDLVESLQKVKKILPYIDPLLAHEEEEKYLLFFANNMELRPGGGFLGSFGILKIKDYTIEDIEIHDVYDADGQLIAHIDPPEPIRKYLQIPHGFLRDSNFSPDFPEDYEKAKLFLEKEINLKDFSGAILITTTAIEHILDAFGNLYIPDFNEYINRRNFYLKAQIHSEKDFFPGSIQKKSFLSSLAKQLIINLEIASPKQLAIAVKKSLDEKQIIMYFDEKEIQDVIDPLYWSGRTIQPRCISESYQNCVVDYLFPYDANVGANKVNFFITRSMNLKTKINSKGEIQHTLSVRFQNESPDEVFPGGTYKNYFQIMLPLNSVLSRVTKDGVLVEDFEEKIAQFKTIGLYFELPPKKTIEVKITYTLGEQLNNGRGIYQLIVQKQIGSSNNDYVFELDLPKNIYILNQNFTALVKENHIVYNTSLTADKIFFIELTKE